jgi:hypothetical protein
MDDLSDSLKFKRSGRKCLYVYKKGPRRGQMCKTHLCTSNIGYVCVKHSKYSSEEDQKHDDEIMDFIKETNLINLTPIILDP